MTDNTIGVVFNKDDNVSIEITPSLFEFEHPANHLLVAISGAIGAAGFPGNLFLICLMLNHAKTQQPHEWLLFNLACIDLLLCFNNVALQAPFILNFHSVACKVASFFEYFFGLLSFTVPPIVAFNRYLSLYNSTLYKSLFTNRNIVFICFGPWILSFVLFLPFLVTDNLGLDDLGLCGTKQSTLALHILFTLGVCPLIFICYAVSLFCDFKVMRKIRQHHNTDLVTIQSRVYRESKELVILLGILLVIPLVAQMPGAFGKLIQAFVRLDPWISRNLVALFPLTSACNSYLTILTVKKYRNFVKRLLCRSGATVTPASFVLHSEGLSRVT